MSKRFLFYLGHPAHYHNIAKAAEVLTERGHQIILVAREKDVLFKLLENTPWTVEYLKARKGQSKAALVKTILSREGKMWRLVRKYKPDLLVGTDIVITHVGRALKVPSLVLNEDDAKEVPFLAKFGFKYASAVLSPDSCNIAPFEHKKVSYPGYHELAYLHPNHFTPDPKRVEALSPDGKPYFILRFAELSAHHDEGRTGITTTLANEIIAQLLPLGRVYITSERKLEPEFEKHRILIKPKDIHHALFGARMYIGDSQTMAAEAAVLGTPAIRFNDFVGKLGYLEELEHRFGLTKGITTDHPEELLETLKDWLGKPDLEEQWDRKRTHMLKETIDVCAFFVWFFETFPDSKKVVDSEVDWASRFR